MDRREIQDRARFLAGDELQYALAREDHAFHSDAVREAATMRLAREAGENEIYELCRAAIDGVWRSVERQYVVDLQDGQLRLDGAIRTGNNMLLGMRHAREQDWRAFDQIRELKFRDHKAKRDIERRRIHDEIIPRLRAHGGDPTTEEACGDLFAVDEAA